MRPLVLALSGGGAHAASHAGALKALDREGVEIAGLVGVSGGAERAPTAVDGPAGTRATSSRCDSKPNDRWGTWTTRFSGTTRR